MAAKRPWPAEAITGLRQGWESGMSAARIAEQIGFSRNAVKAKAAKLGLPARPERCAPVSTKKNERNWPPATIARLHDLWQSGMSATRIGAELGFSKNAIIGKARRLGLPARAPSFAADLATKTVTDEHRETIRSLWLTHSVLQISAITRIGPRRIMAIAADLGMPSRAELVIAKNRESARLRDRPSGARPSTTSPRPRAARTRAVPPSARGSRALLPPPGATLPGVAPLPALQQRRVFSAKCKFPLWSDRDRPTHVYCEAASTMGCYCEEHAVLCYIGTNKSLGDPDKLRWRP